MSLEGAKKSLLHLKEEGRKRYWQKGSADSMSTQLDHEKNIYFDAEFFQQNLPHHYRSILTDFQKISRSFIAFNTLFIGIISLEIIALFLFLPVFSQTSLLALALGTLFLTLFSYVVLLFYNQAKKPEQLQSLVRKFISSCKSSIGLPEGIAQHHLSISETLLKLSSYLQDYEWKMGRVTALLAPLSKLFSRISAYCYWHDVFRFKQLLLHSAIEEHLQQIRSTPTDLEVHASLAGTYVALSQIYKEPKGTDSAHPRQNIYRKNSLVFDEKFRTAANLALEEFQILAHYAPQDPWVHEQLAAGYRDLELWEKEIQEVELLLKLRPQDKEILFRLGRLYFRQGLNAKGLQVYEELKRSNFKQAEELVLGYGHTANEQNQAIPIEI